MKVVLTGGPSAGKTTVATSLIKHFHHDLALIPEAATILYRGGFPRKHNDVAKVYQQRAIYRVQLELENFFSHDLRGKSYICDRGTLDGLAYWPLGDDKFFIENETDLQRELDRYDVVIHLEVANLEDYNSDHSDVRVESHEQALRIDERIKEIWSQHPRRFLVKNNSSFVDKISKVHQLVGDLLQLGSMSSVKGEVL